MKRSLIQYLYILICFIYTKMCFSNARIIRLPIDIRNRKGINFGKGFVTGKYCRIENYGTNKRTTLKIGRNVQINDFVHITSRKNVTIGDNVLIASKVYISDTSHGSYSDEFHSSPLKAPVDRDLISKEVIIGKNVWIGEGVCILPGVKIGEGAIIGANSVVTKNINPSSIAVGSPAKEIKTFNFSEKNGKNINYWRSRLHW